MSKEITGTLHEWAVQSNGTHQIVWGYIFRDTKDRFQNGTYIHTSYMDAKELKEGDIVETLNSTYKLGVKDNG